MEESARGKVACTGKSGTSEYGNGKEENKRERKREIKRRGGRDAGGKVAVEGKRKRAKSRTGGQGWMG